jgi:hypothetical protein
MIETLIELLPRLTVLGILDADNYTPILLLLFILAKPHGGKDGFWFTAGVVLTQLAGGLMFAYFLSRIDVMNTPYLLWLGIYGQIALGILLVLTGAFWRPRPRNYLEKDILSGIGHRPIVWFSIGVLVEITKLMTAVVYFDAIRRVLAATAVISEQLLLVAYFNFIAFLPMVIIWLVYLAVGISRPDKLTTIRHWLVKHEPALIRFAFVAVGLFLVFNGYSLSA